MPLDQLLRTYTAGNTVISRFVAEEYQGLPPEVVAYSVEVQSRVADALIGGLSAEYNRQAALLESSATQQRTREVERLLAEESFSDQQIGYRLDAWHIAGIISGVRADQAARLLAELLGCELLLLPRTAETYWAWWGGPHEIPFDKVESAARRSADGASFAFGECRHGIDGFRLSHCEAQTVTDVVIRVDEPIVRAADAILPALLLRDRGLADLFVDAHLGRLKSQKDWPMLSATLSAYLEAGGALGAAAASLGVDRHTIRRRMQRIEDLQERPIGVVRSELEIALRVDRLLAARLTGRRQSD
jgi:sugar diacid utilization regulator